MKPLSESTVCIVDLGTFSCLAEMFSRKAKRTLYYSPFEEEYLDVQKCVVGDNMEGYERIDDYLDPDALKEIDGFVFPDINFTGQQRLLKSLGKWVWGSMGAMDLELYRTRFLKVLKEADLPVVPSVTIVGLDRLSDYLKTVGDKWIKINRYRANMETWHHINHALSLPELQRLARVFGPLRNQAIFVVQDPIETDIEIGYDGAFTGGDFWASSFQGYEKKNQLYLGSLLSYGRLPEGVRYVNEQMAPILKKFNYCNFWATEIRSLDGTPYFIDPTPRMAGQTMEHLTETCENLPEVMAAAAQGENVDPVYAAKFAAEATLHYTAVVDGEEWKTFDIPDKVRRWIKLYRPTYADGLYHQPPHKSDEIGAVVGIGDTVEESMDHLKKNFEFLKDQPISIELSGFVDLIKAIETAEAEGIKFSNKPLPEPTAVFE